LLLLSLVACSGDHAATTHKASTPRDAMPAGAHAARDGGSRTPQTGGPDAGANTGQHATGQHAAADPDASVHAGDDDAGERAVGDHDAGTLTHPIDICGTRVDLDDYTGDGHEWIFDVSTLAANTDTNDLAATGLSPSIVDPSKDARFPWIVRPAGCAKGDCYDQDAYADLVFADSDTRHTLLHSLAYAIGADGSGTGGYAAISNDDVSDLQQKQNATLGATRVHMAAFVAPNDRIDLQLANMTTRANSVVAWYTDPTWSPTFDGYYLDDDVGIMMIEKGLDVGVPIFLVEKGMRDIAGLDPSKGNPRDIGPVAARFPTARFVVLKSAFKFGFDSGENSEPTGNAADEARWGDGSGPWPEGPYDESDAGVQADYPLTRGVNSLIKSLRDAGTEPNQNVYVALDGVWAQLITRPREAAHVLGKLLLYVGEDNILWGTESVLFYGGPQPQIEAFRNFEIPADMRAKYSYPELTAERKAKILGLNAARLFCIQPE
jgi:predicted TIM-barrel fold metal-dependent hydrolase